MLNTEDIPDYIELHAHSAFAFLEGSARPEAYISAAQELGYEGIALLDRDGMYGAVQANRCASRAGLALIQGCEVSFCGFRLPVLAANPDGYHALCATLSRNNLRQLDQQWHLKESADTPTQYRHSSDATYLAQGIAGQGIAPLKLDEFAAATKDNCFVLSGGHRVDTRLDMEAHIKQLVTLFGHDHVAVEACLNGAYDDKARLKRLSELAQAWHLPLVATTGAVAPTLRELPIAHALSALAGRENVALARGRIGAAPAALLSRPRLSELFACAPQAMAHSVQIGQACAFDLHLLAPKLPRLKVPEEHDEDSWLVHLTYQGARERYGTRADNPHAWDVIEHELAIIRATGFAGYFLIVHDIVEFCRREDILCQGRGSAANSAVCFALGITAVDAVKHQMLFERFLTPDRVEYPDIDIDIEAARRELVIQYVYQRYGREYAAQVANVIEYQPRSAIADAARALGYDATRAHAWNRANRGASRAQVLEDPQVAPPVRTLARQFLGLPRHLGLHSGGMIVSDRPLSELCILQPARHPGRTIVQWDKEDCADVGLVKIDLLGLGMLTALRLAFNWMRDAGIRGPNGEVYALHNIGDDDPAVYDLLCRADTVGVFQVESRAQMSTLPRLRPREFYDIVVEVALIRPGPIQGQAVNPYIRRRNGKEAVTYLHPLLEPALKKTLGVPLFQEQLMRIATDIGGFDAAQADELRRAISAKRSRERMEQLRLPLYRGMAEKGITGKQADAIWEQLLGFAKFGFPESHAFSFAYIVYASAWLKVHYPAYFYAGLIAAQPMGFYSVQSLVQDARRHGVRIHGPCFRHAAARTSVRHDENGVLVQLGFEQIRGWRSEAAERVAAAAKACPFTDHHDISARAQISTHELEQAATAGAFNCLNIARRDALWQAASATQAPVRGKGEGRWQQQQLALSVTTPPALPPLTQTAQIRADMRATGITIDSYPTQIVRAQWREKGYLNSGEVAQYAQRRIWVAGIVTHRQRPGTAKGIVFLTLQDEAGTINVICHRGIWQRYRSVANAANALAVRGIVEVESGVIHVIADKIVMESVPGTHRSRDFC